MFQNLLKWREAVAEVLGWHQRIDVLINCAGRLLDGALDQCEPYEIEQVTQVNVLGVMYLTRAVLPRMKQLGKGRIITIGSQAGFLAGNTGVSTTPVSGLFEVFLFATARSSQTWDRCFSD